MAHQDDLRRWEERRREIYHSIIQNGARATAKAFGISRQRVHQIKERIEQDGKDHARGGDSAPAAGTAVDG